MATGERRPADDRSGVQMIGEITATVTPDSDEIPLFRDVLADGSVVGAFLRDRGVQLVNDATDEQGRAVVDQAIRVHGEMHSTVNANTIRNLLPAVRPALIGARFLALAKAGKLEKIGYVRASHAAGPGRMIADWAWRG